MRKFDSIILGLAAAGLAACGGADAGGGDLAERTSYELASDHAIGSATAPHTVTEFASVTCSHCANWHNTVYPDFKAKYIDTGQVRYVFREFPTAPVELAMAGFLLANCGEAKRDGAFMDSIKLQFERQGEILKSTQAGPKAVRDQYTYIAKEAGLSEEEFETCIQDESLRAEIEERVQTGFDAGITGTPQFLLNGEKVRAFTLEEWDEVLAGDSTDEAEDAVLEDAG